MKKVNKSNKAQTVPEELREMLMADIRDLRSGAISCKRATAMARLSDATMRTMCK